MMPIDENALSESYMEWLRAHRNNQMRDGHSPVWPCPSCQLRTAYFWRESGVDPDGRWRCSHCDPLPGGKHQVTAGEERSAQPVSAKKLLDEPDLFAGLEGENGLLPNERCFIPH